MSMNFSHTKVTARISLLLTAVLIFGAATAQAQIGNYYQKVSIDTVLRTKPALVSVSPKYQVSLVVSGREVTGVSLELSKQKLFSVTLADNHHMIFLDTLTNKGGADLNLILDDSTVLPIHLMVRDVPSGTRVYTFEDSDSSAADTAVPNTPPATAQAMPVKTAAAVRSTPITPTVVAPAAASQVAAASVAAPTAISVQPSPIKSVPRPAVQSTAPLSTASKAPEAITLPRSPMTPPVTKPIDQMASAAATPQPASSLNAPYGAQPAVQMAVQISREGDNAVSLSLNVTSPAGKAIQADLANLKLSDGRRAVPFTVEKMTSGDLMPLQATVKVQNAPAQLSLQWLVRTLAPSAQYMLRTTLKVK